MPTDSRLALHPSRRGGYFGCLCRHSCEGPQDCWLVLDNLCNFSITQLFSSNNSCLGEIVRISEPDNKPKNKLIIQRQVLVVNWMHSIHIPLSHTQRKSMELLRTKPAAEVLHYWFLPLTTNYWE